LLTDAIEIFVSRSHHFYPLEVIPMHTAPTPNPLYTLAECPDLVADGCLCDDRNQLVFVSLWGRDTAVQQFLARLTLGPAEAGLDQFSLLAEDFTLPVFVHAADSLEKRTTRALRGTLFGTLLNLWLFEPRCVKPDKAAGSAIVILPKAASNRIERLWAVVKEASPIPLLDHWRETVLEILTRSGMLIALSRALGPIEGHQLTLDVPSLTSEIGELIRAGSLGITPDLSAVEPQADHALHGGCTPHGGCTSQGACTRRRVA
jgi:hypothetical protein